MIPLALTAALLLVIFGMLLGGSWTTPALPATFRRQAEERRELNAEWAAFCDYLQGDRPDDADDD